MQVTQRRTVTVKSHSHIPGATHILLCAFIKLIHYVGGETESWGGDMEIIQIASIGTGFHSL